MYQIQTNLFAIGRLLCAICLEPDGVNYTVWNFLSGNSGSSYTECISKLRPRHETIQCTLVEKMYHIKLTFVQITPQQESTGCKILTLFLKWSAWITSPWWWCIHWHRLSLFTLYIINAPCWWNPIASPKEYITTFTFDVWHYIWSLCRIWMEAQPHTWRLRHTGLNSVRIAEHFPSVLTTQ